MPAQCSQQKQQQRQQQIKTNNNTGTPQPDDKSRLTPGYDNIIGGYRYNT